jgi:hypothetical protein
VNEPESRTTTAWLVVPVFVYGFAVVLVALREISGWTVLGAALTALPVVTCLPRRGSLLPWAGPGAALVLGFLLGAPQAFVAGSAGMAIFGGVALASPVALAAAVVRFRHDATLVLPVTFGGLVDVLTLRAAVQSLSAASTPPTPGAFALALGQVTWRQLSAIGDLLVGSRSATLPLQPLTDPTFVVLVLLAIVGAFLALFLPETLPGEPGRGDPGDVLVPVLVAVVSVSIFEIVAARAPTYALLGLAVAALAAVVAIRVVARPGSRLASRLRGGSARPAPNPPKSA